MTINDVFLSFTTLHIAQENGAALFKLAFKARNLGEV